MNVEDYLRKQRQAYENTDGLPKPDIAIHPVSGEWQKSGQMASEFWWGGGASREACQQIELVRDSNLDAKLTRVAVLTFGPVQAFLGGGQRLRDWAVGSWLCHYLTAVLIHRWEEKGGRVLLPLHRSSSLLNWLRGEPYEAEGFWRAELPNVITGLHPGEEGWLRDLEKSLHQDWQNFLKRMDEAVQEYSPKLLNGPGWQVIRWDNKFFWSVYAEECELGIGYCPAPRSSVSMASRSQCRLQRSERTGAQSRCRSGSV